MANKTPSTESPEPLINAGRLRMSKEEFDRQYEEAKQRGEETLRKQPRASRAYYDRRKKRMVVELLNGCTFIFPPDLAQGLAGASASDLSEVELTPHGLGLHWDKLDADFTVAGLMTGMFGGKTWMAELGRQGGHVRTEAKAAAARENGKKGGRPRKEA